MTEDGGHIWHYLQTDEQLREWPQNYTDKYWLGLPLVRPFPPYFYAKLVYLSALGSPCSPSCHGSFICG